MKTGRKLPKTVKNPSVVKELKISNIRDCKIFKKGDANILW